MLRKLFLSRLTPVAVAGTLLAMGAMLATKTAAMLKAELEELEQVRVDGLAALKALTDQVMDLDTRREGLESTVRTLTAARDSLNVPPAPGEGWFTPPVEVSYPSAERDPAQREA